MVIKESQIQSNKNENCFPLPMIILTERANFWDIYSLMPVQSAHVIFARLVVH